MASLGIYHWNKDNKSGLEASIASFRKYHPNAPYFVACDAAGGSQYDICKKYNVNYLHADFDLGYPSPHWGFDKLRVYNFMKRMMLAAICMGTTHFIISEDDVICLNEIQFDENWDIASYNITDGNYINQEILDVCERISGVKPDRTQYGAGAGTIMKTSTFIQTFYKFVEFLDRDFDRLHQNQPQLGWNDCFLQVYFFLAGAKYNVNPRLHNIWPENPNLDLDEMKKHYDMVHNYKNFYEGR